MQELSDQEVAQTYGFKPGQSTPSSQYGYDGAGNLVGDPFKGQAIEYNHLHLPKDINGVKITYDASGRKWAMNFTPTKKRYYIGSMEFDANRNFVAANFADGRIGWNEQCLMINF